MAGPWFVDPETGLTTNNGLSVDTPWKLIPGQTGATSQTGYGVVAGDVINIKNGTTASSGVIAFPANNLTYRGYGLAKNTLQLILPDPKDPSRVIHTTVVREAGVHEGMWKLVDSTLTGSGIGFTTRSGCVLEDAYVECTNSASPISIGNSASTAVGATIRRCFIKNSASLGIEVNSNQVTFEDLRLENISDDGIVLQATVANGYRAGYKDTLSRICIIEPGTDTVGSTGDAIQITATTDRYESYTSITDLYVKKSNPTKQAITFQDALAGVKISRFHFDSVPSGTAQILCSGLRGTAIIEKGYCNDGQVGNGFVRYAGSQGITSTGELIIQHNILDVLSHNGLFYWGGSTDAATIDGSVIIRNNYIKGINTQRLSFSATVSCDSGALITLGAGCSWIVENNVFDVAGAPIVRLPSGGANDARWVFRNNAVKAGGKYFIGTTEYASIADFQTAHNAATNNFESDFDVRADFKIRAGSDLIEAGRHSEYRTDFLGNQLWNPPSVGAIEYVR